MSPESVRTKLLATRGDQPSGRGSAADRVHDELRRDLLAGRLPYGERLVEEHLAERFATSRTPVREALRRLESDGHIVRDPAGGTRPSPPRVSMMREIYAVRVVLEDLIVTLAARGGDGVDRGLLVALRDDWAELRDCWPELRDKFDWPDFVYADESFHNGLARASGNRAAARYLRDINERIRVLRIHDFVTADRIEATVSEHLEIAEAVCAGEIAPATALMATHVEASADVVEARVGELLTRMFDAEGDLR
ncbi:MAG: GntR family transcriptional regulator [Solirubrobacteraceae bacterium]|nr:GntR family transcriptional regulator [Solirubrobacteraceae bacterium]